MRTIGRMLRWAAEGAAFLGALALAAMMLQVAADVVLKNLFNVQIPFTQTLVTKWYMVAAAFLPLAVAEIQDRHISVELLYQRLPRRARRALGGLVCLYAFGMIAVLMKPLWGEALKRMAEGSYELEGGVPMDTWQPFFLLPLGFALFALVLVYRVIVLWTGAESGLGETPIDEDAPAPGAHVQAEV